MSNLTWFWQLIILHIIGCVFPASLHVGQSWLNAWQCEFNPVGSWIFCVSAGLLEQHSVLLGSSSILLGLACVICYVGPRQCSVQSWSSSSAEVRVFLSTQPDALWIQKVSNLTANRHYSSPCAPLVLLPLVLSDGSFLCACASQCSVASSREGALSLCSFLFSGFLFHGHRLPLSLRTSALSPQLRVCLALPQFPFPVNLSQEAGAIIGLTIVSYL